MYTWTIRLSYNRSNRSIRTGTDAWSVMKVFRYWTTHPKSEGQCLWLVFATSGICQEQLPAGNTYLFVTNAQHRSTCQPYSGIEPLRPLAQVLWMYSLVFSKVLVHGCLIHLSCIRLQSYVFMLTRWHADMQIITYCIMGYKLASTLVSRMTGAQPIPGKQSLISLISSPSSSGWLTALRPTSLVLLAILGSGWLHRQLLWATPR